MAEIKEPLVAAQPAEVVVERKPVFQLNKHEQTMIGLYVLCIAMDLATFTGQFRLDRATDICFQGCMIAATLAANQELHTLHLLFTGLAVGWALLTGALLLPALCG